MKFIVYVVSVMLLVCIAAPAHAQNRFTNLLDATQKDYENITLDMQDAHDGVSPMMKPRELKAAASRIMARREALADMRRVGLKVLPMKQRGLFRLLIRNLDQVNLSLLALVGDERGYQAYAKNREGQSGPVNWQEGIGMMLDETRRCLYMALKVSGPIMMQARLAPLQAH